MAAHLHDRLVRALLLLLVVARRRRRRRGQLRGGGAALPRQGEERCHHCPLRLNCLQHLRVPQHQVLPAPPPEPFEVRQAAGPGFLDGAEALRGARLAHVQVRYVAFGQLRHVFLREGTTLRQLGERHEVCGLKTREVVSASLDLQTTLHRNHVVSLHIQTLVFPCQGDLRWAIPQCRTALGGAAAALRCSSAGAGTSVARLATPGCGRGAAKEADDGEGGG
mmetsp:Transcript_120375/g.300292  ORF Transcript_120375/g.300292 Transcript_120375/m.300292 type:complete len:222 (+) Transcript_120375:230-895(+)